MNKSKLKIEIYAEWNDLQKWMEQKPKNEWIENPLGLHLI